MSITTKRGDTGQTGLAGGHPRFKVIATRRDLRHHRRTHRHTRLRAIHLRRNEDIRTRTKLIQRQLFQIGFGIGHTS